MGVEKYLSFGRAAPVQAVREPGGVQALAPACSTNCWNFWEWVLAGRALAVVGWRACLARRGSITAGETDTIPAGVADRYGGDWRRGHLGGPVSNGFGLPGYSDLGTYAWVRRRQF